MTLAMFGLVVLLQATVAFDNGARWISFARVVIALAMVAVSSSM